MSPLAPSAMDVGRVVPFADAVPDEIRIAALVFACAAATVLAAVVTVRHLTGWGDAAVARLRGLEGGADRGPGGSILRGGELEDGFGLGTVDHWLGGFRLTARAERLLQQAGSAMSVGELLGFMALAAALGGAGAWFIGWHDPRAAVPAVIGGVIPLLWMRRRRARRLRAFSEQLPDALDLMAGSLRAGHAYSSAVQVVGQELADPIAAEFRTMAEEYRVGLSHRECLDRLLGRVDHPDLRLFAISVLIQTETGGNLAEVLESLAQTVRSRFQLLGRVRTITAEGRLSSVVLAALPIVVVGVLSLLNPGYLSPLVTEPLGRVAIGLALGLQLLGFVWIRRIARVGQ